MPRNEPYSQDMPNTERGTPAQMAEMRRAAPGEICVDLTERSTDELQIV